MSDAVLIQEIATIGAILVAVITAAGGVMIVLLDRTRRHSKAASLNAAVVRDEVKNSHTTNLRDDLDAKHKALMKVVAEQGAAIAAQGRDIGGMREDIRIIRKDQTTDRQALADERERISHLEQTTPPVRRARTKGTT